MSCKRSLVWIFECTPRPLRACAHSRRACDKGMGEEGSQRRELAGSPGVQQQPLQSSLFAEPADGAPRSVGGISVSSWLRAGRGGEGSVLPAGSTEFSHSPSNRLRQLAYVSLQVKTQSPGDKIRLVQSGGKSARLCRGPLECFLLITILGLGGASFPGGSAGSPLAPASFPMSLPPPSLLHV